MHTHSFTCGTHFSHCPYVTLSICHTGTWPDWWMISHWRNTALGFTLIRCHKQTVSVKLISYLGQTVGLKLINPHTRPYTNVSGVSGKPCHSKIHKPPLTNIFNPSLLKDLNHIWQTVGTKNTGTSWTVVWVLHLLIICNSDALLYSFYCISRNP